HTRFSRDWSSDVCSSDLNNNELLPGEFVLYQNYPNPFNPTTKIKYSIPSSQRVRLVVYDILGTEIAVLINEEQHSGAYEITFDEIGRASCRERGQSAVGL